MTTLFTHRTFHVVPYTCDPLHAAQVSVSVNLSVAFTFTKICANKFDDPDPAIGFSVEFYTKVLITNPVLAYVCRGKNVAPFPISNLNIRQKYVIKRDKILTF